MGAQKAWPLQGLRWAGGPKYQSGDGRPRVVEGSTQAARGPDAQAKLASPDAAATGPAPTLPASPAPVPAALTPAKQGTTSPAGRPTAEPAGASSRASRAARPEGPKGPACSPRVKAYFDGLHAEAMRTYAIAKQARRKGLDPSLEVEIPPAEDLAARVEAQVGPPGVAARVRAATLELGNREVVALRVASEVAGDLHKAGASREKALDQAVRTGLSILTEGVLVAPLEGIAEVRIGANMDGSDFADLYFAGPIRAAGGTGQAMSVLIAEVVRRELGIGVYRPTESEIERYKEEIPAYKQSANLQYTPTSAEIDLIVRHCPVCINGEGTEREEVTGNRDLPRVETNQLRGGACLVIAEGLALKAPKIMKHVEKLGLEGWEFLNAFLKKGGDEASKGPVGGVPEIQPNPKFLKDIIAGRPVFAHPSRPGGFRLRYGRARTAGLASTAISPAMMTLVDDFLAVGTQLKVERPGKGTLATPCDELEGPTVLLHNGDLVRLTTFRQAREVRPEVAEIVDLGEILVPFGEFAENNAMLPDASYSYEWWVQEHRKATGAASDEHPPGSLSGQEMVELARATGVPLHPDGTLLWHDLSPLEMRELSDWIRQEGHWDDAEGVLTLPVDLPRKDLLVRLLCLHRVVEDRVVVGERLAHPLLACLGMDVADGRLVETPRRRMLHDPCQPDFTTRFPSVEMAGRLADCVVRPRAPCRVGARMGRPEKADARKMKPPPHGLFPVGQPGGSQRLVRDAAKGKIDLEVGQRVCDQCRAKAWRLRCDRCGQRTSPVPRPPGERVEKVPIQIDMKAELERARQAIGMGRLPDTIKGVTGVINKERTPEPLEKALLRAQHDVWTFKDGTVRYDMTDVPLTHFRPREINAPVERLRQLGYTHDIHGAPLTGPEQLLELQVQDIVVSDGCLDYFLRTAQFIDALLERFYALKPYYNCKERGDLIGHLAIGLAPHTSGGVLTRIIGYTKSQVHFGHPYFHAAKRRNCDGDEDAVLLLMDGLLNFSRSYVPDRRGGLMDLPLVLSTRLDPNEVDKEAHNVDTLSRYPLAFYEATTRHAQPKEVASIMGLVDGRIAKPEQYEGFGFTHDTDNIAAGPEASAYKVLETTMEKLTGQMELARRIRAVDEPDVGARVIGTHLLPDIMGNLKAFSKQKVRCPLCNAKYRRMPLKGACLQCGNPKLTLTVHEGSVRKYLTICKEIAERYHIDPYTRQRIRLLEQAVESLFNNDKVRKSKLSDFL
jgi:DNA polymerase II large subunit